MQVASVSSKDQIQPDTTVNGPACFWEVLMGASFAMNRPWFVSKYRTNEVRAPMRRIRHDRRRVDNKNCRAENYLIQCVLCLVQGHGLGPRLKTTASLKRYWLKHCSATAVHFMADHQYFIQTFHTATVLQCTLRWLGGFWFSKILILNILEVIVFLYVVLFCLTHCLILLFQLVHWMNESL